jgi:hypothetical protein
MIYCNFMFHFTVHKKNGHFYRRLPFHTIITFTDYLGRQNIVFERIHLPVLLAAGEAGNALGVPRYAGTRMSENTVF